MTRGIRLAPMASKAAVDRLLGLGRIQGLGKPDRIYVIEGVGTNLVKIGTSIDVVARLTALQAGSPVELRIEHVERGGRQREKELHEEFAEYRGRGEWFRREGRLERWLKVEALVRLGAREALALYAERDIGCPVSRV